MEEELEQEEEQKNYIEINEENVIVLNEWIYDTIINRTIKELEDDNITDLINFVNEGKRELLGFITFIYLDSKSFKKLFRYIRRAYEKSLRSIDSKRRLYLRKANNQLLEEFKNLINIMIRDERFIE